MVNFTEDLDEFLDTDEFAVPVSWNGNSFLGVFDNDSFEIQDGSITVVVPNPVILIKDTDAAGMIQGGAITVNSIAYTIHTPQAEGTGMTEVTLTKV